MGDPMEETQYDVPNPGPSRYDEGNSYSYSEFGQTPVLETKKTLNNTVRAPNTDITTSTEVSKRPTNLLCQVINSNIPTLAMGCACRMSSPEAFVSFLLVTECLLLLNMMIFGASANIKSFLSVIVSQVLRNKFSSVVSSNLEFLYYAFEIILQGFLMFSFAFILMHSVLVGQD